MKVRDVMTSDVQAVVPGTALVEAARKMRVFDVGMLLVYDGTRILGVVTDRDMVVRSAAEGRDPLADTVDRVMSHPVKTCCDDEELDSCVKKMEEGQVRRLVVLDRRGALAGVVSLGDLAVRGSHELACEAFDRIVEST